MLETLINFFETIPPAYRTGILVAGLVGFLTLESAIPLFGFNYHKLKHALLNLFFTLTTLVVNLVFAFLILEACDFTTKHEFGLLYLTTLPLWLHLIMGLMLLDFIGAYFIHWVQHQVKWMWKFHIIHHSDMTVDVTTGLRHHPGESIFRAVFTLIAVLIAGVPIGMVMIYQTISAIFAQLTHANIKSPALIDKLLLYVFVTPNMHKVHHHYIQPLTDTNYGNIFSIWDRVFKTFGQVDHPKSIEYGIDTLNGTGKHLCIRRLLAIPFEKTLPGSKPR